MNSSASLTFNNGNELTLKPLSLIEIQNLDNEGQINLHKGSFSVTLNRPITLVLGKRKVTLTGQGPRLKINKEGNKANITVLSGKLKISGRKESVGISQINLDENSQVKVSPFHYQLIPKWAKDPQIIQGQKLYYDWSKLESSSGKAWLEVRGSLLKTPKRFPLDDKSFQLEHSGQYTMKIINTAGRSSPSIDFQLQVLKEAQIRVAPENLPLYPSHELPLEIANQYPLKVRVFQKEKLIAHSTLESLSKNNHFRSLRLRTKNPLTPGPYRVVTNPLNNEDAKVSNSFDIEIMATPQLIAPKMTFPTIDQTLVFYRDIEVPLKWQSSNLPYRKGAQEVYPLNINGSTHTLTTDQFLWRPELPAGEHLIKWTISATQGPFTSQVAGHSQFRILKKESIEVFPKTGMVIELEKPQQKVTFEWQEVGEASYQLEVSQDKEFQRNVLRYQTKNNKKDVILPRAGTYYWRSRFLDKDNKLKLGSPTKIIIRPAPPPAPLKIKKNLRIKLKRRSSFIETIPQLKLFSLMAKLLFQEVHASQDLEAKIQWPPERLAKAYVLKVTKNDREILKVTVDEPFYTWTEAKAGKYQYQVAIIDHWERQGEFSNIGELILIAPKKKESITLLSPAHKRELHWRKTEFRFTSTSSKEATLEFSADLSFKKPLLSIDLKRGQTSIHLKTQILAKKLQGREVYWRIQQGSEKNKIKSKRRKVSFHKQLTVLKEKEREKYFGDFEMSQTTAFTQYEQINPNATIKASGLTTIHFGLNWSGRNIDLPYSLRIESARGKAFDDLSYQQSTIQLHYERYSYLFNRPWVQRYGAKYLLQTLFLEQHATVESEDIGVFMATTSQELQLNNRSKIELSLSAGQGIDYRLQYRINFWKLFSRQIDVALYYQALILTGKASDYEKDISRSNLGLSWMVKF